MSAEPGAPSQAASIQKIQELLQAKDDTSRFVGLALLKSVLDNSPELRQDAATLVRLWDSISPSFLRRLLRTGAGQQGTRKDGRDMLDLAVAVIHTFSSLLPEVKRREKGLTDKIPLLVAALVERSATPVSYICFQGLTGGTQLRGHHNSGPPGPGHARRPRRGRRGAESGRRPDAPD